MNSLRVKPMKIMAADRARRAGRLRMNSAFEPIITCEKTAAMTGDAMHLGGHSRDSPEDAEQLPEQAKQ